MKKKSNKLSMVQVIVIVNLVTVVVVGFLLAITAAVLIDTRTNDDYEQIAATASSHMYVWMEQLDEGDYWYDEETGTLYKGDTEITDEAFWMIHNSDANIQHTIFWGDTRVLSDITDDSGASVVGSQLTDQTILNAVQTQGLYTANNVVIYGHKYSVCYVPIRNGNEIVGMVFTGVNQTEANKLIARDVIIMVVITLVLAAATIGIVVAILRNRAKVFGASLLEASGIAEEKKNNVAELGHMNNENMRQINTAIEQVTMAVTEQASHTEEIMGSMEEFGDNLDNIILHVNETSSITGKSVKLIDEMTNQLHELEKVSAENNDEINNISKQIEDDIIAVNDIKKIIDVINDIAFQITILSFNASVEAARAGEAGKGFAVVADSIKDLSDKTKNSLEEITRIIEEISEKMNETGYASEALIKKNSTVVEALANTKDRMTGVTSSFEEISTNIDEIMDQSGAIVEGKNQVVETVSSLAAASEENAAMSQQIKATADEVVNANESLLAEINRLQEITQILSDVKVYFDNQKF